MTFREWVADRSPLVVLDIQQTARDHNSVKEVGTGKWEHRGKVWEFPANADDDELALYFAYRRWCRGRDEDPSPYERLGKVLTAEDVKDVDPNGLDAFFRD